MSCSWYDLGCLQVQVLLISVTVGQEKVICQGVPRKEGLRTCAWLFLPWRLGPGRAAPDKPLQCRIGDSGTGTAWRPLLLTVEGRRPQPAVHDRSAYVVLCLDRRWDLWLT